MSRCQLGSRNAFRGEFQIAPRFPLFLVATLLIAGCPVCALCVEQVTVQRGDQSIQVEGKVVVEAQDGGLLLCARDGVLWMIQPDQMISRESDNRPFRPFTAEQLARRLLAEMPAGFRIHRTAHYVICHNTSPAYARWYGSLVERLYFGFTTYWSHQQFALSGPEMPLVALVFDTKTAYEEHARKELGGSIGSAFGYYNLQTNRVSTYDLTARYRSRGTRRPSTEDRVNRILSLEGAEETVSTIVHEATHQLAYNSGLQVRLADNPFWVSEGLAVYFETPDLKSSRGWKGIGKVNRRRQDRFLRYLNARPANSLLTLLAEDRRFRDPETSKDSYAEAWALNYYLLRRHKEAYVAYLRNLSQKTPLVELGSAARIAEFKQYFGANLSRLDEDFVRYMRARDR